MEVARNTKNVVEEINKCRKAGGDTCFNLKKMVKEKMELLFDGEITLLKTDFWLAALCHLLTWCIVWSHEGTSHTWHYSKLWQ